MAERVDDGVAVRHAPALTPTLEVEDVDVVLPGELPRVPDVEAGRGVVNGIGSID